jgi:glycosyltransferase involved in cell wall biosynthesis
MRVLHVITGLRRAGAETMLVKLIGMLAQEGVENRVVCLIERGPLAAELEAVGIRVISLGMRSKLDPRPIARLIRVIRRYRPDIVQTWLYHADFAGLVAVAAASSLARLIWNIRCSDMDFAEDSTPDTARVVRLLARLSARPAGVIVNSHAGRLYHERLGYRPQWWNEIPNGFDLERWRPDGTAAARLRAQLGLPDNALVVGMFARVAPMKDHINFLSAFAQVRAQLPAARAVLAGRGTEALADMLVTFGLQGRVVLLGERSDLPSLLPGLDVFCLSSAFGEGFANVLGEAMACAIPCIATDVGDARDIVGDTGCIVPPRQPGTLADALGGLLSASAEHRSDLGARARLRIEQRYSLGDVARRYMDVYTAVLAGLQPSNASGHSDFVPIPAASALVMAAGSASTAIRQ